MVVKYELGDVDLNPFQRCTRGVACAHGDLSGSFGSIGRWRVNSHACRLDDIHGDIQTASLFNNQQEIPGQHFDCADILLTGQSRFRSAMNSVLQLR
jgi:hypothetical protein